MVAYFISIDEDSKCRLSADLVTDFSIIRKLYFKMLNLTNYKEYNKYFIILRRNLKCVVLLDTQVQNIMQKM